MGVDAAIDISTEDRQTVLLLLQRHLPGTAAWVYGSRVKWTSRPPSDLDLVVFATPKQRRQVGNLREAFEERNLPFRVDLFVWDEVPESFRRRIQEEHVVLVDTVPRDMSDEWVYRRLEDCMESIIDYRGKTPRKTSSGIPLITAKVVKRGRIETPTEFIALDHYASWMRRGMPQSGDVLITTEAPLGEVAQLEKQRVALAQRLILLRGKSRILDNRFLRFLLQSDDVQVQLRARATGTTVLGIKQKELRQIEFSLPPIPEQRAIAHILGTLDDKIELNRRMNVTLEAMARALFRSWFVDFDPVRAKMEGRDTGLPKEIAGLFPDRLVDSELGQIPEGWETGVLDEAIELLNGGTPRTSVPRFWDGNIPWYTAKDAPVLANVFVVDTERTITQAGVDNSATTVLPPRTTIITARGTVGRLACVGRPMAMNQTCYGIRGTGGYPDYFVYWLVRMTVEELRSRTHGTIFDTITRQTFNLVDFVRPPMGIRVAFESIVTPIMERLLNDLYEIRALSALRDTLLPKLVSGEVRMENL